MNSSNEYEIISSIEKKALVEKEISEHPEIYNANFHSRITSLDTILGKGWKPGQIVVISGATGQGKTTWAQTLSKSFSEQELYPCWFTYEVDDEDFFEKFGTDVPMFYLPKKTKRGSIPWLEERIRESVTKFGTRIIFIDHLHYLVDLQELAQSGNTSLYIGILMQFLGDIAKELKLTIFLIVHLNKTYEETSDTLPSNNDLRDSSFIAQEADMTMFVKRKFKDGLPTDTAVLKIGKNRRNGNLGNVPLQHKDGLFVEYVSGASQHIKIQDEIFDPHISQVSRFWQNEI